VAAEYFVLHEAEPLGAAAAVAILQQHDLRGRARRDHLGLQELGQRRAKHVLAAGMFFGQRIDRRGDPRGIETFILPRGGLNHDAVHGYPITDSTKAVTEDCKATADLCWILLRLSKAVLATARSRYVFSHCATA